MFDLQADRRFNDLQTNEMRERGSVFTLKSLDRVKELIGKNVASIIGIRYRGTAKRTGKDIYIFVKKLYFIGGIETSLYNLVKSFPERKFTIICEGQMDFGQALRLSEYCDIKRETGGHYKCDVAIMEQYDSTESVIDRVEARKIYHQCHADWNGLRAIHGYENMMFVVNTRTDAILAVSKTAQKGLKDVFGYDSKVVPNILAPADEKPLVFVCLSRGGTEKGLRNLVDFAKACQKSERKFVIFLASSINTEHGALPNEIDAIPEIVKIEPSIYAREILHCANYLIQLSENESYCYSVREGLQLGVPAIVSKIPELEAVIKNGKNGYVLGDKITDADIKKIFEKVPHPEPYTEAVPKIWEDVLNGKL